MRTFAHGVVLFFRVYPWPKNRFVKLQFRTKAVNRRFRDQMIYNKLFIFLQLNILPYIQIEPLIKKVKRCRIG